MADRVAPAFDPLDRGREGFRLPALRTVRAGFSHPALQSVVSSSGVSRSLPSRVKSEQPGSCEESVWPALTVENAPAEPRTLGLLAQERPQPPTDEAVERAELGRVGVLEVAEPSLEHRVQRCDDPREAGPTCPSRLRPDGILE